MRNYLFLLLMIVSANAFAQTFSFTEWENEKVVDINKEPAHATFMAYRDEATAIMLLCR